MPSPAVPWPAFEPALDYVVVKLPRFPFDKFPGADRSLGSQMKATGEVMAIDRTFGAALNKALRGLEQAGAGFLAEDPGWAPTLDVLAGWASGGRGGEHPPIPLDVERLTAPWRSSSPMPTASSARAAGRRRSRAGLLGRFLQPSDSRLWRLLALLRRGVAAADLQRATGVAPWFLSEMERLTDLARRLREAGARLTPSLCVAAKRASFSDRDIGTLSGLGEAEVPAGRRPGAGLRPGYAMVDTCAASSPRDAPTSTPPTPPPARSRRATARAPARGAGHRVRSRAHRAGHRVRLLRRCRRRARCGPMAWRPSWSTPTPRRSPPTSTPRRASTSSHSMPRACWRWWPRRRCPARSRRPALVQFGGQTPLNLAAALVADGVRLPGIDLEAIERTEERTRFAQLIDELGISQPRGGMATSLDEALAVAETIGYPVLVRPSFVIGGLAIDFCHGPLDLERQLAADHVVSRDTAGPHRRLPRGPGGRCRCHHRRSRRAHPGAHGSRGARRRALGRQHRRLPAAAAAAR